MGKPYKKQPTAPNKIGVVYKKEKLSPYEFGKWYENSSGRVSPTASPIDYAVGLPKVLQTEASKTVLDFMLAHLPEKIAAPIIWSGVAAATINHADKKRQAESLHWAEPTGSLNNEVDESRYPLRVYKKKPFIKL